MKILQNHQQFLKNHSERLTQKTNPISPPEIRYCQKLGYKFTDFKKKKKHTVIVFPGRKHPNFPAAFTVILQILLHCWFCLFACLFIHLCFLFVLLSLEKISRKSKAPWCLKSSRGRPHPHLYTLSHLLTRSTQMANMPSLLASNC